MLAKNPAGGLPFIELKNGVCIAETVAIASYLEDAESTNGEGRKLLNRVHAASLPLVGQRLRWAQFWTQD